MEIYTKKQTQKKQQPLWLIKRFLRISRKIAIRVAAAFVVEL